MWKEAGELNRSLFFCSEDLRAIIFGKRLQRFLCKESESYKYK